MGIRHIMGYKVFNIPLYVIGLSGVAGVLVDLDHIIALGGRFLHTPLLIGSGVILIGCCAYITRLHLGSILRNGRYPIGGLR